MERGTESNEHTLAHAMSARVSTGHERTFAPCTRLPFHQGSPDDLRKKVLALKKDKEVLHHELQESVQNALVLTNYVATLEEQQEESGSQSQASRLRDAERDLKEAQAQEAALKHDLEEARRREQALKKDLRAVWQVQSPVSSARMAVFAWGLAETNPPMFLYEAKLV